MGKVNPCKKKQCCLFNNPCWSYKGINKLSESFSSAEFNFKDI